MSSKKKILKSTETYLDQINKLRDKIEHSDAIVIGAGAGLSTSAGHLYSGERFVNHFSDFKDTYGILDMYSGGFYPYKTLNEYWAWWSRHIKLNRYDEQESQVHKNL